MFHGLAPVMSSFGMKMLKKMGWQEGQPLGKKGEGQSREDGGEDRGGEKSLESGYLCDCFLPCACMCKRVKKSLPSVSQSVSKNI